MSHAPGLPARQLVWFRRDLRLADLRYKGGIASYLQDLTARQSRYTSARTLIGVQLLRATNRVALYRALGGDSFQP